MTARMIGLDWREKMDGKRFRLYAAVVVALLGVAALPGGAEAVKVLNISAASFVAAASDVDQLRAGGNFAVLSGEGKFFANVPIENGRFKRFTLCARDNDADFDVTARLIAKPIAGGLTDKTVLAEVSTSGASTTTQCPFTGAILEPQVRTMLFFYVVEIEFPDNSNIDVWGVQITH